MKTKLIVVYVAVTFKISADIKWIKMNVNFTGYYRVHYDELNWKALTRQLQDNHLVKHLSSLSVYKNGKNSGRLTYT